MTTARFTVLPLPSALLETGTDCCLTRDQGAAGLGLPGPCLTASGPLPELKAGHYLDLGGKPAFQVLGRFYWPTSALPAACWLVQALRHLDAEGPLDLTLRAKGKSLAWITLSDKGSRGERVDASGPLIEKMAREALDISLARGFVIPDEPLRLKALLADLALSQGYDFILTTGGTGVGPRDVTPEATLALIEKRLPGFERAMTATSLAKTPHAAISRAVAGTLGHAIIVNMPGSPKAVAETLAAILPALGHASDKLCGDPADCGR